MKVVEDLKTTAEAILKPESWLSAECMGTVAVAFGLYDLLVWCLACWTGYGAVGVISSNLEPGPPNNDMIPE
jgi:hypothetical protein